MAKNPGWTLNHSVPCSPFTIEIGNGARSKRKRKRQKQPFADVPHRKHLCWSLFLIKFIKKRLQHRCSPVKFAKFLRTPIVAASKKGKIRWN